MSGARSSDKHEVAWEVRKGLMALEPGEDVLSVFRDVIVPRLCDRDAGAGAGADACRLWAGRQADAHAGGGWWDRVGGVVAFWSRFYIVWTFDCLVMFDRSIHRGGIII